MVQFTFRWCKILSCKYPYNYLIVQTFLKIKNQRHVAKALTIKIYTNYLIFRFGLPAAVVARVGQSGLINVCHECRRVIASLVYDHLNNPLDRKQAFAVRFVESVCIFNPLSPFR